MAGKLLSCATCGAAVPEHLIDAKPNNARYRRECKELGPWKALVEAIDRNDDFTRFECRTCYGPGWVEGVPDRKVA